jgi:hypothetical protein
MSVEVLLLLFIFLVLPLIEQLVRKARQKQEEAGRSAPAGTAPRPQAPRRPEPDAWDEEEDEEDEVVVVAPPRVPSSRPPASVRRPPVPVRHQPPPVRRPVPAAAPPEVPREVLLARQARARLRLDETGRSDLALAQSQRRRVYIPELHGAHSLRRAIVLTAVLGPCKANETGPPGSGGLAGQITRYPRES